MVTAPRLTTVAVSPEMVVVPLMTLMVASEALPESRYSASSELASASMTTLLNGSVTVYSGVPVPVALL